MIQEFLNLQNLQKI